MTPQLQQLIQDETLWFAERREPGFAERREPGFAERREHEDETARLRHIFKTNSLNAASYKRNKERGFTPLGIESIDAALPEGGLLHGVVHEFIAKDFGKLRGCSAKLLTTNLIIQHIEHLLRENSSVALSTVQFSKYIIWLSRKELPSPFALLNGFRALETEFSLAEPLLGSCLFVSTESDRQLLQTIDLLLGSPAVSMLIAEVPTIPFADERRFAVRTKQHDILSIFLREEKALFRNSAFHSRWSIAPYSIAPHTANSDFPAFTLTLENKKGTQAQQGNWNIAFQDIEDRFSFQEVQEFPQALEKTERIAS